MKKAALTAGCFFAGLFFVSVCFPQMLMIPPQFGKVQEIWSGGNSSFPHVIVIEDAHAHYEAQNNIVNILTDLKENHDNNLVIGIEGAFSGKLSSDKIRLFEESEKNTELLNQMLEDGNISGAEYFRALNNDLVLFGVEDENLYMKNLYAYKKFGDMRNFQTDEINLVKDILRQIADLVLSDECKQLRDEYESFIKGKDTDFLIKLRSYTEQFRIDVPKYSVFGKMSAALDELAVIDEKKLHYELRLFHEKEAVEFDLTRSFSSMEDNLRQTLSQYPILKKSALLKNDLVNADFEKLNAEVNDFIKAITYAMARDENEKKVLSYIESFDLFSRFLELSIPWNELGLLKEVTAFDYVRDLEKYIQSYRPRFLLKLDYSDVIENRNKFYFYAQERDNIMVNNFLSGIKDYSEDISACVLIVGGFHGHGVCSLLREKKVNYTVVRPLITDSGDKFREAYFDRIEESAQVFFDGKEHPSSVE